MARISLKKYIEKQLKNNQEAITLQATEYHRRLDELNHEKEQLRDMQQKYVLQETYDVRTKDVDSQLRVLNSFKDNIQGRLIAYSSIIIIISIGISVLLKFF